jgi:glutathione S-transferase
MDYIEIDEAMGREGLRLVLTPGVPGPWGEAAKAVFHVKKIAYQPVRQPSEQEDRSALLRWTRQTSAPVAMFEGERPRSRWDEILFLAERIKSSPSLVPPDPINRVLMFGLAHEICGEHGLGWTRRLQILGSNPGTEPETMPWKYGVEDVDAVAGAAARIDQILDLLARQLEEQRSRGRRFLVGEALSAVDLYWACFSNMLAPLPPEQSAMPSWIRRLYDDIGAASEPPASLLELRDLIFTEFLTLPQDY